MPIRENIFLSCPLSMKNLRVIAPGRPGRPPSNGLLSTETVYDQIISICIRSVKPEMVLPGVGVEYPLSTLAGRTEDIGILGDNKLFQLVARRAQIFAGVKFRGAFNEDLSDYGGHNEAAVAVYIYLADS
jgi:hypothetical protein